MPARERWALFCLHQAASRIAIWVGRGTNAHVAPAFLHDDAKNYPLLYTNLGGISNGVIYTAYIFTAIPSLEHRGLVDVEKSVEILPGRLVREGRGWTRVERKTHPRYWEDVWVFVIYFVKEGWNIKCLGSWRPSM